MARRVGRPIMITENGVATDDDGFRIRFIREHLREAVRGGHHWLHVLEPPR